MTAMTTAVAIGKFLSKRDRPWPILRDVERDYLDRPLWARPVRSSAQSTGPDREGQHDDEEADHENRGQPVRRLLFASDPDHDPGDVIGAPGLRAPEAVAVGGEHEFALGIRAAGHRGAVRIPGGKPAHFGVHHWFTVRGRELSRNLVRSEEIERTGRRCDEKIEGCEGAQQQGTRSAWASNWATANRRKFEHRHAINIAIF